MRAVAKILRARASEHSSNFCEQFEQRPNFASTFKFNETIQYPLSEYLTHWMTNQITNWSTDRPTDWQTDWLTDCLIDWLTDWLTDWMTAGLTDCLTDWLNQIDRPTSMIDWLPPSGMTDRLTCQLTYLMFVAFASGVITAADFKGADPSVFRLQPSGFCTRDHFHFL